MRLLVELDLTSADIAIFDAYEAAVLPLVAEHGGRVEARVRAVDGTREVHLVFFPSTEAFNAYKADPRRASLAEDWRAAGAVARLTEVETV